MKPCLALFLIACNAVSFTDEMHPVPLAVVAAMEKLERCIAPTMTAYRDSSPSP